MIKIQHGLKLCRKIVKKATYTLDYVEKKKEITPLNSYKIMKKEKTFDNSSATINSTQMKVLKTNFPQCFDKNGDFIPHRMQEVVNKDAINLSKESYTLNWLGKSYARLLANEASLTLLKEDTEHNQKTENQNSENLLIKGDNLEVLKHLRYAYSEQVKMIYIDPPYNTGSDGFVYADNRKFSPEQLQRLAGIDEDEAQRILDFTNSKSNSHSAWLTFIYPRLYIARELLSDDGVIFISIDDNEQAQLKMLCDEIFGEENLINSFVWSGKSGAEDDGHIRNNKEHIICYAKDCHNFIVGLDDKKNEKFIYFDKSKQDFYKKQLLRKWGDNSKREDRPNLYYAIKNNSIDFYPTLPNGEDGCWRWSKHKMQKAIESNMIEFAKNEAYEKIYKSDITKQKKKFKSLLLDSGQTSGGTKELRLLFEDNAIFSRPKPTKLLINLIKIANLNNNTLILDFFAGSGTTADSVMQLNAEDGGKRKCISVQLDEAIDPKKNKTAYDFVKDELGQATPTVFDITKERILRAGAKIQKDNKESKEPKDLSKQDFGFKVFETLPMFEGFFDEMEELDKQQTLFDGAQLSDDELQVLLTSWMVNDGIKLTKKIEKITLNEYTGYYADRKLYLMDKGFTTDGLKALLEKLDRVDGDNKNFQPSKLVLFGYNFKSKHQREISEALNSYTNKKQIELDRVIRY